MAIIISKKGNKACVIQEMGVADEARLEQYVFDTPESLPVHEIKTNAKLMVLAKQFGTGSGPIDVLAVDADGDIYVIETKLFKNPDKRLVIAQVLDYGASLWRAYGDPAAFISDLDSRLCDQKRLALVPSLSTTFDLNEEQAIAVVEAVKRNLVTGNIHFIVLMNRLDDRLKNLIQFLNQRAAFNIYAVEMEFYRHDDVEIVIPTLFGTEAKKPSDGAVRGARKKWDENTFFENAAMHLDQSQLPIARRLYDFCRENGRLSWGTSSEFGSFSFANILYMRSDGTVSLVVIPKPRHSAETARDIARTADAMEAAGFSASDGKCWDCYRAYSAQQWMPRVDELIATTKKLIESPC